MSLFLTFATAAVAMAIFATMAALPWLLDQDGPPREPLASAE